MKIFLSRFFRRFQYLIFVVEKSVLVAVCTAEQEALGKKNNKAGCVLKRCKYKGNLHKYNVFFAGIRNGLLVIVFG